MLAQDGGAYKALGEEILVIILMWHLCGELRLTRVGQNPLDLKVHAKISYEEARAALSGVIHA